MAHQGPTVTPSDKSYGWSVGAVAGVSAFVSLYTALHVLTKTPLPAVPLCAAAGFVIGFCVYKWASSAKARWRDEQ
jgi:hypothetical protein